jgi:hypothetical protein
MMPVWCQWAIAFICNRLAIGIELEFFHNRKAFPGFGKQFICVDDLKFFTHCSEIIIHCTVIPRTFILLTDAPVSFRRAGMHFAYR